MADGEHGQPQVRGGEKAKPTGTGTGNEADHLVQESSVLRWEGHRMQGATIALGMRFDDTVKKLESRGDREARIVLLGLAKEVKQLNGVLAARHARLSMVNRTVVEILQKSEDGKAALMMRKAAELLVKGLANAEEEVHSLKATVREVEGQRDHYKDLLARTNSELDSSQAYAQMSKAIGQAEDVDSAAASASASSSGGADDAVIKRSAKRAGEGGGSGKGKGKGKAPARQAQQKKSVGVGVGDGDAAATLASRSTGGGGSGSGSGGISGDESIATKVAKGGSQHGEAPRGAAEKAKKGKGRTAAAVAAAAAGKGARIAPPAPTGRGNGRTVTTGNDAASTATTASKKRRREAMSSAENCGGVGGGSFKTKREQPGSSGGPGGEGEGEDSKEEWGGAAGSTSSRGRGEGALFEGVRSDDTQIGVEVPVSVSRTGPPWSGDGNGDGNGNGGGGSEVDGSGEGEDGGGSEEYDSDDAPSMFF